MKPTFTADFFRGNRERLRGLFVGTAPIVMPAAGLLQRSGDTSFPFRQDSNFWYLTGIEEPDVLLVIDKTKEYLIVPRRGQSRTTFDGGIDYELLTERSGIGTILDDKEGWKLLRSRLKRAAHVAIVSPPPEYIDSTGLYTNPARAATVDNIKQCNPAITLLDLRPALTKLRAIKQPVELEAIQSAIDMTAQVFRLLKKRLGAISSEKEVEALATAYFIKAGAQHAYAPIVASGKNGCTVHYIANSSQIAPDDFVLLDIGAEVHNYAADITRTYHPTQPTKRQQSVLEAVVEVQAFAKSLLKPGVLLADYEKQVEHFMGEKLRALGLIQTIETATVRKYYPYMTSHFLGLDVHDVGDYTKPLEPGMVLTVEPGIHIPEERIAIRIEDDVLITQKGIDVLSKKLKSI